MVYILLGNGFEEMEAIAPYDILKRGGVDVAFAGIGGLTVTGAHGIPVGADCTVEEIDPEAAQMLVVPGGMGGVTSIEASPAALDKLKQAWQAGAHMAAICAGPRVLAGLGILNGHRAVCYPGMESEMIGGKMDCSVSAVTDGNLTTGRGPGSSIDFGLLLLEVLKGQEAAEQVAAAMHY